MKTIIKLLAVSGLLFVLAIGVCAFLLDPQPPKEASLIQNFNEHRVSFEQLRDMLQAETNLTRVAGWGVETFKPYFMGYPLPKNFPTDRFNKYQALLKEVGGMAAARSEGKRADPLILVWAWGWAGDVSHICIGWLEEPPTNHVSSLAGYLSYSTNREVFYREVLYKHIDQNWYFWSDGIRPIK